MIIHIWNREFSYILIYGCSNHLNHKRKAKTKQNTYALHFSNHKKTVTVKDNSSSCWRTSSHSNCSICFPAFAVPWKGIIWWSLGPHTRRGIASKIRQVILSSKFDILIHMPWPIFKDKYNKHNKWSCRFESTISKNIFISVFLYRPTKCTIHY